MYRRNATGWMKHADFIIWEEISLQIAFIIAYFLRHGSLWIYGTAPYRNLALFAALIDFAACIIFNTMHNVVKRGYFREFMATFKQSIIVFIAVIIMLFSLQSSVAYSRIVIGLTLVFHILIAYLVRLAWKRYLKKHGSVGKRSSSMLAILNADTAGGMLHRLTENQLEGFDLVGVVLDRNTKKSEIHGIPVVCEMDDASQYICREWIDSVYIDVNMSDERIRQLVKDCRSMAVPIHYHVPSILNDGNKEYIEKIGGTTVLTKSFRYLKTSEIISKRILDIFGGLVGSAIALVIMAIVGPKIKKESPGPILYRQERIGENGRRFTMLKIRSMYLDADVRKAELMNQNRISDGFRDIIRTTRKKPHFMWLSAACVNSHIS